MKDFVSFRDGKTAAINQLVDAENAMTEEVGNNLTDRSKHLLDSAKKRRDQETDDHLMQCDSDAKNRIKQLHYMDEGMYI